jgi:hypothetical protein
MSQKHYIITLIFLIICYLLNLPLSFPDFPFFAELNANYSAPVMIMAMFGAVLYWIPVLVYFKKRQWRLSFYSGIALGLAGITLHFLIEFSNQYDRTVLILMGLISLVYISCEVVFSISLLSASRTNGLKFIRLYGMMGFLSIALTLSLGIIEDELGTLLAGLLWTIVSVVFILHFIYERNKQPDKVISEDILDNDLM